MNSDEPKSKLSTLTGNVKARWRKLKTTAVPKKGAVALWLSVGLAVVGAFSLPVFSDNENSERRDGNGGRDSNQRENREGDRPENRRNNQSDNRAHSRFTDRARGEAHNRADERARDQAHIRANDRAQNQANIRSQNYRSQNRSDLRWDYSLNNQNRYKTYKKYRNSWNEQRSYLRSNIGRFNQIARLNQLQQQQLDNQMRAAFRSFHHNDWNGPYTWNNYSDPRFLDYLQSSQPSLLQSLLSSLGLGGDDDYLYSSDWDTERSQLAQNIANIHRLAVNGRISASQERQLQDQLRSEFMAYKNNNWNGATTWSQYSDAGFVDYLQNRRPTILTTVRDYLSM